jgi:hypothetical protein
VGSDDREIYERLARLEEQSKQQSRALIQIESKQDEMLADLARYRGWTGGVLAVIGLLITAFKLFGGTISGWFA